MSSAADGTNTMICASCGTAGGDDIKLKQCACHLVKYCSVKCQKDHRPQHKKECKKRVAELKDEILFKQPESSDAGDCPICCLPLPLDPKKSVLYLCCSKFICMGCDYANKKREIEGRLQQKCAFCRKSVPSTDEEEDEQVMERIKVNDPLALSYMGSKKSMIEGDHEGAFEYFTKAAAMGNAESHYHLFMMYRNGTGVEKDRKREWHHAEQAAIGGHPLARHNLACMEGAKGQHNRAGKHLIIAAKLGFDKSLEHAKFLYQHGLVSEEDFAVVRRGYQAAIDATKSPQREEAYKFYPNRESRLG